MSESTPFSEWSRDGLLDPHGEYYKGRRADIAMGDRPCKLIGEMLPHVAGEIMGISWLIAAKERLRWLSRKLYRLSGDHELINQRRAQTANGEMTDDILANAFFMSESKVDLEAGRDRILWLLKEIEDIEGV